MLRIKRLSLILILASVCIFCGCSSSSSGSASSVGTDDRKIGVLLPLTGNLSGAGKSFKTAIELAASRHSNCELVVKDTQSMGMTGEAMMAEFEDEGVDMIIGPAGSEVARWAKDYADKSGQTLLSCSCTATSLAIPNDSLFRFAVPDTAQAQVLVDRLSDWNITHIAIFVQSDIYGSGLAAELTSKFTEGGGTVFQTYDMRGASSVEDMTYILDQLSNDLEPVLTTVDESQIGIVLVMYEQAVTLLEVADSYDTLDLLNWFGTDSLAMSGELLNNDTAASFALKTDFTCPIIAEFDNDQYDQVKAEISNALGYSASAYTVMYHDAVDIVMDALERAGGTSASALRAAIREAAEDFTGATGPVLLDANGDRDSHKIYNFWEITVSGGDYSWKQGLSREIL